MSNQGSDDTFIRKLIDETYECVPEPDTGKGANDLFVYFNKQKENVSRNDKFLLDLFLQQEITHFLLPYIDQISCFRIQYAKKTLDIPINWSIFNDIYQAKQFKKNILWYITKQNNRDLLLQTMGPFLNYDDGLLFVAMSGDCYLALIPETDTTKLSLVKSFLF